MATSPREVVDLNAVKVELEMSENDFETYYLQEDHVSEDALCDKRSELEQEVLNSWGIDSGEIALRSVQDIDEHDRKTRPVEKYGRQNINPVRKLFTYERDKNISVCTVLQCNAQMRGTHAANLERHIQRHHPYEHTLLTQEKLNRALALKHKDNVDGPPCKKILLTTNSLTESTPRPTVDFKMDSSTLTDACIELVTTNGRSFKLLDDSGFRKILDPLLEVIGNKVTLSSYTIQHKVTALAARIRDKIKAEVKNQLLCLKVDAVSCQERYLLSINMQYISEGELCLRTLAVKEFTSSHTEDNIKAVLLDVMSSYGIHQEQIYSLTTDEAVMGKHKKFLIESHDEFHDSTDEDIDTNVRSGLLSCIERLEFENDDASKTLHGVRCFAYNLWMAIEDAMNDSKIKRLIGKARSICKRLRSPTIASVLKRFKLKKPSMDCCTAWYTTCEMLEGLLKLKDFCNSTPTSNQGLCLSEEEWDDLEDFTAALMPAKVITKVFQSTTLTIGDVYGAWLKYQIKTSKMPSKFAKSLSLAMKKHETKCLDSDTFRSCVYLDPRYNVLLSDEDNDRARTHLTKTWTRLQQELSSCEHTDYSRIQVEHEEASTDELDVLLKSRTSSSKQSTLCRGYANKLVRPLLETFLEQPLLNRRENILLYWEAQKLSRPELFKLYRIVFAVPATQASVEEAFSSLRFVMSTERSTMSPTVLEDVLLVRANNLFRN